MMKISGRIDQVTSERGDAVFNLPDVPGGLGVEFHAWQKPTLLLRFRGTQTSYCLAQFESEVRFEEWWEEHKPVWEIVLRLDEPGP